MTDSTDIAGVLTAFGRLTDEVRDLATLAAETVCSTPFTIRVADGATVLVVDTSDETAHVTVGEITGRSGGRWYCRSEHGWVPGVTIDGSLQLAVDTVVKGWATPEPDRTENPGRTGDPAWWAAR